MIQIHYVPPALPGSLPDAPHTATTPNGPGAPVGPFQGEQLVSRQGRRSRLTLADVGLTGQTQRNQADALELSDAWQALSRETRADAFRTLSDATTRVGPDGRPNLAALLQARRQLRQWLHGRLSRGPVDPSLGEQTRQVDALLGRLIRRNARAGEGEIGFAAIELPEAAPPRRPWDRLTAVIGKLVPTPPVGAKQLHAEGLQLSRANRPDAALAKLEAAARLDETDPGLHLDLGRLLAREGYHAESEWALLQADTLRPHHADTQSALGEVYTAMGQAEMAQAAFGRAVAIAPGHTDAHAQLGVLHYESGDLAQAARHFHAAVSLDPKHVVGRYYLAQIALQENDLLRARFQLGMVARLDPSVDLSRFGLHDPATLAVPLERRTPTPAHHWQLPRSRAQRPLVAKPRA